eukprot:gene14355-15851_t
MTGRARGRSRGRSRAPQQQEAAPRPGAPPEEAPQQQVARGRGRTAPTPAQAAQPQAAQPQKPAADVAQVSQKLAATSITGAQREEQPPLSSSVLVTKPANIEQSTGTFGASVNLRANFFRLIKTPQFDGFFQYMVSFDPPIESRKFKSALLHDHAELLGDVRAFDGMILYLPKKLPETETKLVSVTKRDQQQIEITVKYVNKFPFQSPTTLNLISVIFRRILKLMNMTQIGRSYFSKSRSIELEHIKLELWPGYETGIHTYDAGCLLNLDVSHKVMRTNTVLSILYDLYHQVGEKNFYNVATKKLVGEIVLTRYNNKTYKIDDIAWEEHPTDSFPKRDGTSITYKEYYKGMYDYNPTDDKQPLLVSNPKKRDVRRGMTTPIKLLPEFCYITGISDEIRSNFNIMKELSVHTRMAPQPRAQQLNNFMVELKRNDEANKKLTGWNIEFDSSLMNLKGRIFPPEKLSQREKSFSYKPEDADWSRDMRGAALISTINLDDWALFFTRRDGGIAQDFYQTLCKVNGPMNINTRKPSMVELNDDRAETYIRSIKEQTTPSTQLVVCIVPNNRKDRYDAIKKYCCVDKPVPSQVIVSRTLSKKQMLMSVSTKIGIQLNCKLGGEIWAVEIPVKNMMVVGYDVYHDSLTKGKSIGGFVASTNQALTRYYSRITEQQTGIDIIDGLRTCMTSALRKYNEINNTLPDRIIIYRDGVGDGMLPMVYEHEMPQVKKAIEAIAPGYNPKFAWIVVKKRINAKFFREGRDLANPIPGTVIDTEVTKPEWYDFYLVSQSVRQGTVSPTHYNVIHDSSGLKPDHIQRLTYKLTHLYYNWQGTIRVPAPCQYAHKLAFLVGQSVHTEPAIALSERLYFL